MWETLFGRIYMDYRVDQSLFLIKKDSNLNPFLSFQEGASGQSLPQTNLPFNIISAPIDSLSQYSRVSFHPIF
jgi:hypothetical protein